MVWGFKGGGGGSIGFRAQGFRSLRVRVFGV